MMRLLVLPGYAVILIAVVMLTQCRTDARLLRSDPDAPVGSDLREYALRHGRDGYDENCSSCHGAAGEGDTRRGVPNLRDVDWLYGSGSVADIEQIITYGIRSGRPKSWNLALMPAYASEHPNPKAPEIVPLTPPEIVELVEWIYYAQGRDVDRTKAARGAILYRGKGGCYDCHGPDLKGDGAIGAPNLTDRISLYGDGSRGALADSIAFGRQGVCPDWLRKMAPAAIRETAMYVRSLSEGNLR